MQEREAGLATPPDRLLDAMEMRLNEGYKFSNAAAQFGIGRNVLSRLLSAQGWGGVYHHVPMAELREIIAAEVPLGRA